MNKEDWLLSPEDWLLCLLGISDIHQPGFSYSYLTLDHALFIAQSEFTPKNPGQKGHTYFTFEPDGYGPSSIDAMLHLERLVKLGDVEEYRSSGGEYNLFKLSEKGKLRFETIPLTFILGKRIERAYEFTVGTDYFERLMYFRKNYPEISTRMKYRGLLDE